MFFLNLKHLKTSKILQNRNAEQPDPGVRLVGINDSSIF